MMCLDAYVVLYSKSHCTYSDSQELVFQYFSKTHPKYCYLGWILNNLFGCIFLFIQRRFFISFGESHYNSILMLIFFQFSCLVLKTYAAFMRCFGFGLLNLKMWSGRTAKGVSVKTLQLYSLVFSARLISIFRHQGYLPFDQSGDWFYHFVEFLSLGSVCVAIYGIFGPLVNTYEEKYDRFGNLHIPNIAGAAYVVVPCVIVAVIFHP